MVKVFLVPLPLGVCHDKLPIVHPYFIDFLLPPLTFPPMTIVFTVSSTRFFVDWPLLDVLPLAFEQIRLSTLHSLRQTVTMDLLTSSRQLELFPVLLPVDTLDQTMILTSLS
jgi:hypothetical protein